MLNGLLVGSGYRFSFQTKYKSKASAILLIEFSHRHGSAAPSGLKITGIDEINRALLRCTHVSGGDDGINLRMIRTCFDSAGWVLLHLVNSSIAQSDVPQSWKHSLVHPIHKSGSHSYPANFRTKSGPNPYLVRSW